MNTQVDKKIHDLRSYLGLSLKAFGEPIGYTGMHISRFVFGSIEYVGNGFGMAVVFPRKFGFGIQTGSEIGTDSRSFKCNFFTRIL